jgi:hypothetical protein
MNVRVHWRKYTKESDEKPENKFDPALKTIFRISNCFQARTKILSSFQNNFHNKSKQKLIFVFA